MKKEFFKYAGILFSIAAVVLSVILGIRAGLVSDDVWQGFKTGGACLFGAALFVLGMAKFMDSVYDAPIAKVLWAISLIGIATLGVFLIANEAVSPTPVVHYGLAIGAGMFACPILLVAAYCCVKFLIVFIDEHRIFSIATVMLAAIIGVAMYFVAGTLSKAFSSVFAFLFFWGCITVFVYAWKGVESEENARYWRIAFAIVITFLTCGLCNLFSELLLNVTWLHDSLVWISYNVGLSAMYCFLGYLALVFIAAGWSKLVSWAK